MKSDLGACEKWLIFNESHLELIHPSTPYRDSSLSKVTVSPGNLDTKIAVIFGVLKKPKMWSTIMAMLSPKIWIHYRFQKAPTTTVYAHTVTSVIVIKFN